MANFCELREFGILSQRREWSKLIIQLPHSNKSGPQPPRPRPLPPPPLSLPFPLTLPFPARSVLLQEHLGARSLRGMTNSMCFGIFCKGSDLS